VTVGLSLLQRRDGDGNGESRMALSDIASNLGCKTRTPEKITANTVSGPRDPAYCDPNWAKTRPTCGGTKAGINHNNSSATLHNTFRLHVTLLYYMYSLLYTRPLYASPIRSLCIITEYRVDVLLFQTELGE
jgi:hypothetical protein